MKKTVVCIFAHPDDEAFGPSGTIALLAQENDVYILCATKGQSGKDSDFASPQQLHQRRVQELLESAKILGVKKVFFLGFKDGTLCNNLYHKLADKIENYILKLQPEIILTFENKGISGHIDHITVSMVATYVFEKHTCVRQLYYYCRTEEQSKKLRKDYFIYYPPGYPKSKIDKTFRVDGVWKTKIQAMYTHKSQKHDADRILECSKNLPKEECFLVLKK